MVWRGGGRAAPAAVCATALMGLGGILDGRNAACANRLGQYHDLAEFLRGRQRQEGPVRVAANGSGMLTNFGGLHGIDELTGFVASAPADLPRHELHTIRTRQLFGVTHHVGAAPNHAGQRQVFTGASGLKVFLNPGSLPRAWISHRVRSVRADEELRTLIQDPRWELRAGILMPNGAPYVAPRGSPGAAGPEERGRDAVRIPVDAACRGMLVLAETWTPGWEAVVDGEPAALHKAFGVFRGSGRAARSSHALQPMVRAHRGAADGAVRGGARYPVEEPTRGVHSAASNRVMRALSLSGLPGSSVTGSSPG